ncbi:MAG: COG3650 family protein [Qipengyuania sp.]
MMRISAIFAAALAAGACQAGSAGGDDRSTEAFSAIGPDETIQFTGTEPFWGGEVRGASLIYSTPENIDGVTIAVERFDGNSGTSFSGELDGRSFDLTITEGSCSDGMSDRTYPFNATLKLDEEVRSGCAYTESQPFTGSQTP